MSTVEITCFSYTHYTVSTVCGHVITKEIVFLNKFLHVLCVCVHAKKASGGGGGEDSALHGFAGSTNTCWPCFLGLVAVSAHSASKGCLFS